MQLKYFISVKRAVQGKTACLFCKIKWRCESFDIFFRTFIIKSLVGVTDKKQADVLYLMQRKKDRLFADCVKGRIKVQQAKSKCIKHFALSNLDGEQICWIELINF